MQKEQDLTSRRYFNLRAQLLSLLKTKKPVSIPTQHSKGGGGSHKDPVGLELKNTKRECIQHLKEKGWGVIKLHVGQDLKSKIVATPAGVFLGLECFGKLTKNQESGERDTFSSLSDMLTTLLTGRNCGNCGETQNLISNMSQTRQKRAKPNLKHKFPSPPELTSVFTFTDSLMQRRCYWQGKAITQLERKGEKSLSGERGKAGKVSLLCENKRYF